MASMASSGGLTDLILMRVRIDEGGWGHKTGIKLYIYHPINLHGVDFRFYKL